MHHIVNNPTGSVCYLYGCHFLQEMVSIKHSFRADIKNVLRSGLLQYFTQHDTLTECGKHILYMINKGRHNHSVKWREILDLQLCTQNQKK